MNIEYWCHDCTHYTYSSVCYVLQIRFFSFSFSSFFMTFTLPLISFYFFLLAFSFTYRHFFFSSLLTKPSIHTETNNFIVNKYYNFTKVKNHKWNQTTHAYIHVIRLQTTFLLSSSRTEVQCVSKSMDFNPHSKRPLDE